MELNNLVLLTYSKQHGVLRNIDPPHPSYKELAGEIVGLLKLL